MKFEMAESLTDQFVSNFEIQTAYASYSSTDVSGVTTNLTTMIVAYLPSLLLLVATLGIAKIAYGWVKRALYGK